MTAEAVFSPVHLLSEKKKKVFVYSSLPLMRVQILSRKDTAAVKCWKAW